MAFSLAPYVITQFFDNNGDPLSGGLLYSYQTGTTTPQATYTDATGMTPNANPIVLDSAGRASVWLDQSLSYKFVLHDANGNLIETTDGVIGILTEDAVPTSALQDGAVTSDKIAEGAVTAGKIGASAVTRTNLAADATTDVVNLAIAASVSSNALTIALKGANGSDPSSSNPVHIAFRNATAATGTPVNRTVSGALSVVVSSGSTLGHASGADQYVWVYAIDNAGTVELAVSGRKIWDEFTVQNTTAEGGAGAADSGAALYSTTARTGVAVRLIGRIKVNEATAGTWATAPSEISITTGIDRSPYSCVHLNDANGHGSTNTMIVRFSTAVINVGTAITWADTSTDGTSLTINEDGIYAIQFSYGTNAGARLFGVSLNSAELTTNVASIVKSTRLTIAETPAATAPTVCSVTVPLRAKDVIRPHTDGTNQSGDTDHMYFTITQVSRF